MKEKIRFNARKALMYVGLTVMSLVSTSAMAGEVDYPAFSAGSQTITLRKSDNNFETGKGWYYTFTTGTAGSYTFESSGDLDTYILINDDYVDNDSGEGKNFKLTRTLNAHTTYTILIYSFSGEGSFTLSISTPCYHTNVTHVTAKPATCTETGNIEYYLCNDCGKKYSDAEFTDIVYDDAVVTPIINHDFDANGICKVCGLNAFLFDYISFTATDEDVLLSLWYSVNYSMIDYEVEYWKASFYGNQTYAFEDYSFEYSYDKMNWTSKTAEWQKKDGNNVILDLYYDYNNMPNIYFQELPQFGALGIATIPAGKTLYIRHKGDDITNMCYTSGWGWTFSASGNVKVSGNVMSLLSKDMTATTVGANAFCGVLPGEVEIVSSATSPDEGAYNGIASNGKIYLPQSVINAGTSGVPADLTVKPIKEASLNDEMTMTEIEPIISSEDEYSWVTYERTVKANWNTICLPFAVSSTDATKYYTIKSLENGVITLQYVEELPAATPALMNNTNIGKLTWVGRGSLTDDVNEEISSNRLVGTLYESKIYGETDGNHIYYGLSANTGKYVKVTSDITIKPFRAYIECENNKGYAAGLRQVILGEDDNEGFADAINEVADVLSDTDAQYFDINGRKTNGLQKGLNIIKKDGKSMKVMVK